jgi:hypothetical protein
MLLVAVCCQLSNIFKSFFGKEITIAIDEHDKVMLDNLDQAK